MAVSRTKGCYLGQETIARIDSQGHVNYRLTGLVFRGGGVPPPGTELITDGKQRGSVTSAAFSPKFQAALAWGIVRREYALPGKYLQSEFGEAKVVEMPVYRA